MSLTEEERKQFFATKSGEPTRISMKGKSLKLANLPEANRRKILDRLAEKDEVMAKGKAGILPGLIIDGKQITRDNIHEFELKSVEKEEAKRESEEIVEEEIEKEVEEEAKKYTKAELNKLTFSELRDIGYELGVKGRSKEELIKDILNAQ